MSGQLAFNLPATATYSRAEFSVTAANALALTAIDNWQVWPQGRMMLVGPVGAGKTHLAQIWAAQTGASVIPADTLHTADIAAMSAASAVVIENASAVAGSPDHEKALFHLYNMLTETGVPLLLTAAVPPRDWGIALPDLASRMQACAITRIDPPDDALLSAVLQKLFADRQIVVPPTLIPYLLLRMDRSIAAARHLVAALDAKSLADGRPITRSLAATLLDKDDPAGE